MRTIIEGNLVEQEEKTMPITDYDPSEVVRRGKEIYERDIRPKMTPADKGKMMAVDIVSGDYEMDAHERAARERLRTRHPDAVVFQMRVGYPAAHKIGGGWREEQR